MLKIVLSDGFLSDVARKGAHLRERLEKLAERHSLIRDVRGIGLMQAIDLAMPGANLSRDLREEGVLVNCTADTVLRFLPPLVVSNEEIDEMTERLDYVLSKVAGE